MGKVCSFLPNNNSYQVTIPNKESFLFRNTSYFVILFLCSYFLLHTFGLTVQIPYIQSFVLLTLFICFKLKSSVICMIFKQIG